MDDEVDQVDDRSADTDSGDTAEDEMDDTPTYISTSSESTKSTHTVKVNAPAGSVAATLEKLVALVRFYSSLSIFSQNNVDFFEAIAEKIAMYDTNRQLEKLSDLIDGLDELPSSVWKTYNLNKSGVMTILEFIQGHHEKKDGPVSVSSSGKKGKYISISYPKGVSSAQADELVLFTIADVKEGRSVKRATWHFGNGMTRGCERDQCDSKKALRYGKSGTYNIMLSIRFGNGDSVTEKMELRVK